MFFAWGYKLTTVHFLHLLFFHGFPLLAQPHHKDTQSEPQGDSYNTDEEANEPGLFYQILLLWSCNGTFSF